MCPHAVSDVLSFKYWLKDSKVEDDDKQKLEQKAFSARDVETKMTSKI